MGAQGAELEASKSPVLGTLSPQSLIVAPGLCLEGTHRRTRASFHCAWPPEQGRQLGGLWPRAILLQVVRLLLEGVEDLPTCCGAGSSRRGLGLEGHGGFPERLDSASPIHDVPQFGVWLWEKPSSKGWALAVGSSGATLSPPPKMITSREEKSSNWFSLGREVRGCRPCGHHHLP